MVSQLGRTFNLWQDLALHCLPSPGKNREAQISMQAGYHLWEFQLWIISSTSLTWPGSPLVTFKRTEKTREGRAPSGLGAGVGCGAVSDTVKEHQEGH